MKGEKLTKLAFEKAISFKQPFLEIKEDKEYIYALGDYIVSDGHHNDGPIKTFSILLAVPRSFPREEPVVLETSEFIPRIADRHMYPDGRCCTCVWPEWLAKTSSCSIEAFCNGPLNDFFVSQVYFEAKGCWPFGERSHGAEGIAEAINNVLGLSLNLQQAIDYSQVLSAKALKGHWSCPCGSQKRLRDCCQEQVRSLHRRTSSVYMKALYKALTKNLRSEAEGAKQN